MINKYYNFIEDQNKEYLIEGCFQLGCAVIANCFVPLTVKGKDDSREVAYSKAENERIRKIRIEFADSPLINLLADCADSLEHNKIKKEIIKFNS
jgi:hypothetical protein